MKKLIATLLVLLLLVAGAGFALPLMLSSESVRQEFGKKISAVSGMDITLGGPVSFSLFPEIGLVAKDVTFASPDGGFLVMISKIVSGVKLSSLLSDKIEITALSLTNPEVTIAAVDRGSIDEKPVDKSVDEKAFADPLAAAVEQLDRLSLKKISVTNGTLISLSSDGGRSVISDINTVLEMSNPEGQLDIALNANIDTQGIFLTGSVSALRSILQRQPSGFELAIKLEPAPHPALADLTASGEILLANDGSYKISDGLFTSLDQPLHLDLLYRPGPRPYASLKLEAERVDLGDIKSAPPTVAQAKANKTNGTQADIAGLYLVPLAGIDADIAVKIDKFTMDNVEVRAINMAAALKNGLLEVDIGNIAIANGSVTSQLSADINEAKPTFRGSVRASALKMSDLARLANTHTPLTGNLGLEIIYAFRGLNENIIRKTFNVAGKAKLTNGVVIIPAPEGLGKAAKTISDLNFEANISHVQKPIDIKGKMVWNGEAITFATLIAPHNFIGKNAGPVKLSVRSGKVNADYSGKVNLNGTATGQLKLSTKSLEKLMTWIGQESDTSLGAFSYNGKMSVDANSFAFEKASFALNGIKGTGSGSVDLYGKPSIVTDLSFGELDITAILAGNTKPAKKGAKNNGSSNDVPIDLSALKGFDANIKFKAKKVKYGKVVGGPLNANLTIKDAVARITLPKMPFYGGSFLADITANGSRDIPAINIDAKLSNINALPFFSDAADFNRIEGKLNTDLKIRGAGKTSGQFTKSLKGNSSAKFVDGAIRGINIAKIYNNLAAILAGGFKEDQNEKTTFTEVGLSFDVDQGVATTNDIKLLGPLVRMDGAGKVDLGAETIDMRLNPSVVSSVTGQGGQFDLGGISIPVMIQGSLSKPRVFPDLQALLKNPQAATELISKLGLNIKGLGNPSEGLGKNLVENLISKIAPKDRAGETTGGEKLVESLIGQFLKPNKTQPQNTVQSSSIQDNQPINNNVDTTTTGRIPVPTPSPRRRSTNNPKPKSAEQKIVDKLVPQLNLPIVDNSTNKTLNDLFNNILQ